MGRQTDFTARNKRKGSQKPDVEHPVPVGLLWQIAPTKCRLDRGCLDLGADRAQIRDNAHQIRTGLAVSPEQTPDTADLVQTQCHEA
jgi:hypothetical protein